VAVQGFTFLADDLAQPFGDERAFHIVIVNPALVPGVVRRVDVDALHLPGVVGQQRLERLQIVSFHNEIACARVSAAKLRHILEQTKFDLVVMVDNGILADPVECGHEVYLQGKMAR
jgi:hypothetical protein